VYVLDPRLQDDKSIPKWDSKARLGVFVGYSHEHSSTVPLIYNPKTQHISLQYHVIFDDTFSTISSFMTDIQRATTFEKLFDSEAREFYIDPADVDAGKFTDSFEKVFGESEGESEGDCVDGPTHSIGTNSEGAVVNGSEGAVVVGSEGESADCTVQPRRSRRLLSRLASIAITGLYTAAASNPFSENYSWVQRPATVANVGTRYAAREATVK
jgi:hypothetical protein